MAGRSANSAINDLLPKLAQLWAKKKFQKTRVDGIPRGTAEWKQLWEEYQDTKDTFDLLVYQIQKTGLPVPLLEIEKKGMEWFLKEIGVDPKRAALMKRVQVQTIPEPQKVLTKSELKQAIAEDESDELNEKRLFEDFEYFCRMCLEIQYRAGMNPNYPDGGYGKFFWTEAQTLLATELLRQAFIENKPVRIIILKSRQLGCTTLVLAFWIWMCLTHPHFKCMFIIDKNKHNATKRYMINKWLEDIERKFGCFPKIEKRDDAFIAFDNRAMFLFESAEAPNPGTSEMIHALHESEKPKWPSNRAQEVRTSITPGIPRAPLTFHINESTAEGVDLFMSEWERAETSNKNQDVEGYTPIFFPWYISKEYSLAPPQKCYTVDGKFIFLNDDLEVAEYDSEGNLKYTESAYANKYKLTPAQVYWRRIKIKVDFGGDRTSFDQEYPTTPEHAWRGVNAGFFPKEKLDLAAKEFVRPPLQKGRLENKRGQMFFNRPCLYLDVEPIFVLDRNGWMEVWDRPIPGEKYFLGGDVAEGKTVVEESGSTDPDWTRLVVKSEKGIMVGMGSLREKPEETWIPLLLIARYYNDAYVNVERNGPGATLLSWFYQTGYPNNMVWPHPKGRPTVERMWTLVAPGQRTKPLSDLRASYNANISAIRSSALLAELRAFIVHPRTGRPEARSGHHDDIVFAEMHAEIMRLAHLGLLHAYMPPEPEPEEEKYDPEVEGFRLQDTDFYNHPDDWE